MCSLIQTIKNLLENAEKASEKELKKRLLEILNKEDLVQTHNEPFSSGEENVKQENSKVVIDETTQKKNFELVKHAIYLNQNQKVPSLEWFKSLDETQMKSLVQEDKQYGFHMKLVHRVCKQYHEPTELIIYLIEKGFMPTIWETSELIKDGNFELVKYYAKSPLIRGKWNLYSGLREAIKIDREDIFKFLIEDKVFGCEEEHKKAALEGAVNICFEKSSVKFLKILINIFPSILIPYVRSMYDKEINWLYVFKPTPTNEFLLWLWDNNFKWNKEQAVKINNSFMLSFFS